jgi:septum site-determining protein MinC
VTIATRPPRHSFRFRGRNFLALVLRPEKPLADWLADLDQWLERSPGFFTGKPLILDLAGLGFDRSEIVEVLAELGQRTIRILGIEGADAAALDDTLPPLLTGGRTSGSVEALDAIARKPPPTRAAAKPAKAAAPPKSAASKATAPAKAAEPSAAAGPAKAADSTPPANDGDPATPAEKGEITDLTAAVPPQVPSLLIEAPVRSGQTIINPDGDVIILGAVASGAEVIAAGSIHVYGALRGRALAGAYGNESARIFCRRFEAELIAIGGYYKVTEETETGLRQKPVQTWLSGNDLKMASLDQSENEREIATWRKS